MQFRNYLLTINNCEMSDNELKEYIEKLDHLKYCVFQREKGKEKETEHIQMYIEFSIPIRFERIKKWFSTAHIERRRGTRKQAREYCMKEDTRIGQVIEIGEWVEEQGKRNDLEEIVEMIKSGASDTEILSEYPTQFLLYNQHIARVREMVTKEKYSKEWRDVTVYYIWGATGTGKSRYVREKYGYENVYAINNYGSGAFDSYTKQDVLILEEFRSDFTLKFLLQLLDGYPLRLPARYFDKVACFTKVYILSNVALEAQYPNIQLSEPLTWQAFTRRIDYIFWFGNDYEKNVKNIENKSVYFGFESKSDINESLLKKDEQLTF